MAGSGIRTATAGNTTPTAVRGVWARGLAFALGLAGLTWAGAAQGDAPPVNATGAATAQAPAPNPGAAPAPTAAGALEVGAFSKSEGSLPAGWEPLEFKSIPKHTEYKVERDPSDADRWVVHAESKASASGLIRKLSVDLREYPVLRWRWKVAGVIPKSDPTVKVGDDYAARIYIAFRYEPARVPFFRKAKFKAAQLIFGDIPISAINYIWATKTPVGSIVDNPFAGDFVKMIPVRSGSTETGTWVSEQHNVYEDYKKAFGDEPPLVDGVAVMTDTDNTGESATAWYGDIEFVRAGTN